VLTDAKGVDFHDDGTVVLLPNKNFVADEVAAPKKVKLSGSKMVRPGRMTTLKAKFVKANGPSTMQLEVPAGLVVEDVFPRADIVPGRAADSGTLLQWDVGSYGGVLLTGYAKVKVSVADDVPVGTQMLVANQFDSGPFHITDERTLQVGLPAASGPSAPSFYLSGVKSAPAGQTTQLLAVFKKVIGAARVDLALPAGLALVSSIAPGANQVGPLSWEFPADPGAMISGKVKVVVAIDPSLASGTVLLPSGAISSTNFTSPAVWPIAVR
jgi:hypothetical protein